MLIRFNINRQQVGIQSVGSCLCGSDYFLVSNRRIDNCRSRPGSLPGSVTNSHLRVKQDAQFNQCHH